MDGRTRYNKICNLLEPIVGKTMHLNKIRRRVMIDIGTSPLVVEESVKLMIELGLIKETDHMVFMIIRNKANI